MSRLSVFILVITLFAVKTASSSDSWTLEDCISYAIDNNIQLKRELLRSETARHNYNHSLTDILPSFGAFFNHDLNSGRALNIDTYEWENREFEQGNMGIEARLVVFGGFHNYNNVQHQRFILLSTLENIEHKINTVSLQVAAAYYQILMDKDLVEIAGRALESTSFERAAVEANYTLGNVSRGVLLEIESQVASDRYQYETAKNNLSRSYLDLIQIMQLDPSKDFRVVRPANDRIDESAILMSADEIYEEAVRSLPVIKSAEYFLKGKEREIASVRSQMSPRLSLRGLVYTRYSELATHPVGGGSYPYSDQMRDNSYRQLGISLTVPIFDGLTIRNRINNSKISYLDASYQLDATRQSLYSEVHQMHNNSVNALNRYFFAKKAAESAIESFEFAKEQFRLGLISFVDLQNAQSGYYQAESNIARAKYEYQLRTKILEYYLGEPLK